MTAATVPEDVLTWHVEDRLSVAKANYTRKRNMCTRRRDRMPASKFRRLLLIGFRELCVSLSPGSAVGS